MNTDINTLLATLNDEETDLYEITIYFQDGYEITFDENRTALLWEKESFYGVTDSYWEDLIEYEGIKVDDEIYEFEYFEKIGDE